MVRYSIQVIGPWDSFDQNKTKVVGSLIKKFVEAKMNNESKVILWGSGETYRELIFAEDVAEGLCQTLEKYNNHELPLNIGHNEEIKIKDLAIKIAILVEYQGDIIWDRNMPDGQRRKILSNKRMKERDIKFNKTELDVGIKKTIEWYKQYGRK